MNKIKPRILLGSVLCLAGVFIALAGVGLYLGSSKVSGTVGPGSAAPAANAPMGRTSCVWWGRSV